MPNSRELALLIWLFAFLLWALSMHKTRSALGALLRAATAHKILSSVGLMIAYIGSVVACLYKGGLWVGSQTTTTVFWSVSVGFVALTRVNSVVGDEHYFRNAALDQMKLVTVFDFLVNFYVFNIWVELIVVPVTAQSWPHPFEQPNPVH